MAVTRSLLLFVVAALAEIGGAWLVWQGIREHRGWVWVGGGLLALAAYGFVATLQPDAHFGRILAEYGGVFVAGSLFDLNTVWLGIIVLTLMASLLTLIVRRIEERFVTWKSDR